MKYSKIYTGKGDHGITSLWNGPRVGKEDRRIETVGVFDELNAIIGVAFANSDQTALHKKLREHTNKALIQLMAEIVGTESTYSHDFLVDLTDIYDTIGSILDSKGDITGWVTYGTSGVSSAYFDLSSTVARRAEVALCKNRPDIAIGWLKYMNLLSKVLFLFAR